MTISLSIVADATPPVPLPGGMQAPPLRPRWTREGQLLHRECPVPIFAESKMRTMWKCNRLAFLQRGWSIRQHNGKWILSQWLRRDGGVFTLTPVGQDRLGALLAPDELPLETAPPPELRLSPLPGNLESKLLEYQVQPARQLFRALMHGETEWGFAGALDASDMGIGKTYEGLAAAIATGRQIGVVCPLSCVDDWRKAFSHFAASPLFVKGWDSLRYGNQREVRLEPYIDTRGRKRKRYQWELPPEKTAIIFDEIHKARNAGTLQQIMVMAAIRQRFMVLGLSGTVAEHPIHLRAVGRILGLHQGGLDWERFLEEHGCTRPTGNAKTWKFSVRPRTQQAMLFRIHRAIFPMRGARVRKADLGDRFPDKQIILKSCETPETAAIAAAYREAEETLRRLEAQGESAGKIEFAKKAAYMRARHLSERAKISAMVELAQEAEEEGYSVPIFVNFDDVRIEIMKRLRTTCGIYGDQTGRVGERQRCVAAFVGDTEHYIVANTMAGGTGVNLQDIHGNRPRYSIVSPSDNATDILQVMDRTHRATARSKATIVLLFAAGTVEETICRNIRRKSGNIGALNDGDLNPGAKF